MRMMRHGGKIMGYAAPAGWGPEFALAAEKTVTEIFEKVLEENRDINASGEAGTKEDTAEDRDDG